MSRKGNWLGDGARKQVRKAVRSASETEGSVLIIKNLRGQNPAKPQRKKIFEQLAQLRRDMAGGVPSIKTSSKIRRKRTTPGTLKDAESAPASPHREGARWIKTLKIQTAVNNKIGNKRGNHTK